MEREDYMRAALALAHAAAADGEVPVGCVIVDAEGRIIGRGRNRRERTHRADAHAEMEAIAEACRALGTWRLDGCALYVTLEPCPMCAGAIINARIKRVYIGARDPKAGSFGSVINFNDLPYNHKPELIYGVCEKECSALLTDFFRKLREKKKEQKKQRKEHEYET